MRGVGVALALMVAACSGAPAVPQTPAAATTSATAEGSTAPSAPVLETPDRRGTTPPAPEPTLVRLPTQGPSIQTPVPCMGALTAGVLVAHGQWGIALAVESDGSVLHVVWPHGFAGRWDGDRLALVDGTGTLLAHVGDTVEFGGGHAGDGWIACTDVKVLAKGPE
jgi:hypothetical protein